MRIIRFICQTLSHVVSRLPSSVLSNFIYYTVFYHIRFLSLQQGVRFLMFLDSRLYLLHGNAAVKYGNGLHIKHRYMRYHDFFVHRIRPGERVLDVGCGIGVVAYNIATKAGAEVTGIDLNARNIIQAQEQFRHEHICYRVGDVLTDLPDERFDVVILSNVLEHIEDRVEFLRNLCRTVSPNRILIRVPLFERDWRVPLKQELGVEYRLDPNHFIEYTHETFAAEINEAGMTIAYLESRWGEIWAEVIPSHGV